MTCIKNDRIKSDSIKNDHITIYRTQLFIKGGGGGCSTITLHAILTYLKCSDPY